MSCLRLFNPQLLSLYAPAGDEESVVEAEPHEPGDARHADSDPMILPFRQENRWSGRAQVQAAIQRVRLLRRHQTCPHCQRPSVVPLTDFDVDQLTCDLMPVPGLGVVTGFYCEACGEEWQR